LYDPNEILDAVDDRLKKFVRRARYRPSDETVLIYVLRDKVAKKATGLTTSNRQLSNLKKSLSAKFGKHVEIIHVLSDAQESLEDTIILMLNNKFTGNVTSLYMSFENENIVNSWIEVSELSDDLKNAMEIHYAKILEDVGLGFGTVQWIDSTREMPTFPWLLRFLKSNQPINIEDFADEVVNNFPSVNRKWLNHKLDQLRKKNLLIRETSGNYVLTVQGLSVVPAGASYSSSDVDRALALGRKRW
jgi:hypothetical protein